MRHLLSCLLAGAILTTSGCQLIGPDPEDSRRTYPAAMEHPAASFVELIDGVHEEGKFNLTSFVIGISECPEDAVCLVADHIQVAESPHTDGIPLFIDAEKPSQFEVERQYVFSITVTRVPFPETSQSVYVRLLGYTAMD